MDKEAPHSPSLAGFGPLTASAAHCERGLVVLARCWKFSPGFLATVAGLEPFGGISSYFLPACQALEALAGHGSPFLTTTEAMQTFPRLSGQLPTLFRVFSTPARPDWPGGDILQQLLMPFGLLPGVSGGLASVPSTCGVLAASRNCECNSTDSLPSLPERARRPRQPM